MFKSSHWYRPDATACFEVANASKGGMRPVKITDAKKLGLLPSVTTVLNVLSKPQLDQWKLEQVATAAFNNPRSELADKDAYVSNIIEQAFQQVDDAADLGTAIHKALEQHFQGRDHDPAMRVYVEAVDKWVKTEGVEFIGHELRLASVSHGFAGTTDAAIRSKRGVGILDFKSRKTQPGKPATPYDTQAMQIAAYYVAKFGAFQDDACGVNVFISTTEPGRIDATWYDAATIKAEWQAFDNVLAVWRHLKGFDPRVRPSATVAA